MVNKLYSMTFFSRLILFVDNSENVVEKRDRSKFKIHYGSVTSYRTKMFCGKFLGPLWKILTCWKSICEKVCPNPLLIHIIYMSTSHSSISAGLVRSGIQGLLWNLYKSIISWELCETRVKIHQNFPKNYVKFWEKLLEIFFFFLRNEILLKISRNIFKNWMKFP